MQENVYESNIITGIVVSRFDDRMGPKPLCYFPVELSTETLNVVSNITIDLFISEQSVDPSLLLIPFPNIDKKGLVICFAWEDQKCRGKRAIGSISLLFESKYDSIFYKYFEDFRQPFVNLRENIVSLLQLHTTMESLFNTILKEIIDFQYNLFELLNSLSIQELTVNKQQFVNISPKDMMELDYRFKFIVVGDPTVGKSSIILRYTNDAFHRSYISTIGVNLTEKFIKFNQKVVDIIFWDLAGQLKYETIRQSYYNGSEGIIIVYDSTDRRTFENAEQWYHDIIRYIGKPNLFRFILCGNKIDKEDSIQVSFEEGQALANKLNIKFFQTSALTGQNVSEAINNLTGDLLELYRDMD
jgi:Ras-related protein Rab-1A